MADFKALMLSETDGKVSAAVESVSEDRLPDGDVTVRVERSTLNYKDGMVIKGLGRLVRTYPHISGIDFAGTVEDSKHPNFKPGDAVILTGWRVGEVWWGGHAQKARVKGDWLVKRPAALSADHAMAIGTAGFTSMLCILALEAHGLKSGDGEVLVTGAAGGVGSIATALLAARGYSVAASTGRPEQGEWLKSLGAATIVPREEIATPSGKPLDAERWAGCVDAVGGSTLACILPQMRYGASVSACGLAGGPKLETTVIPFLLRGVNLLGIDSVMKPLPEREAAWARLAEDLPTSILDSVIDRRTLSDLPTAAGEILDGKIRGRVVVDVNA